MWLGVLDNPPLPLPTILPPSKVLTPLPRWLLKAVGPTSASAAEEGEGGPLVSPSS